MDIDKIIPFKTLLSKSIKESRILFVYLPMTYFFYITINAYIFHRLWHNVLLKLNYPLLVLIVFFLLSLAYPLARIFDGLGIDSFGFPLISIGSLYLGIMIYMLSVYFLIDSIFFTIEKIDTVNNSLEFLVSRENVFAMGTLAVFAAFFLGYINSSIIRVRKLKLKIDKKESKLGTIKIVMLSDIHLGKIVGISHLRKVIKKVNKACPDLVLLLGDTVDEGITDKLENLLSDTLRNINSKYGVFSVSGNHEYYGGVKKTLHHIRLGNVIVLEDEAIKVADSFYIIGRKDFVYDKMGEYRKRLADILRDVDKDYPLILLDHQPLILNDAHKNGIDLQLSGHTHNGQMFPINIITKKIFEKSCGYLKKGNTQYYITSGVGTWGPPVRIGTVPEIVEIQIEFRCKTSIC